MPSALIIHPIPERVFQRCTLCLKNGESLTSKAVRVSPLLRYKKGHFSGRGRKGVGKEGRKE